MTGEESILERRYRALLRCYPADYRAHRGDEMLDTYVALVDEDRRWPSAADTLDVLAGATRAHLRSAGVAAALPVAATVAIGTVTMLAAFWLTRSEVFVGGLSGPVPTFGPFQTLGAVAWLAWLAVGFVALALPGRAVRVGVVAALAITVALLPAAALMPYDRPTLVVLVPQLALGLVALGLPNSPGGRARLLLRVVVAVVTAIATAFVIITMPGGPYRWFDGDVLAATAAILLIGLLIASGLLAVRGDDRGWLATLLLLPALVLLLVEPLTGLVASYAGTSADSWALTAWVAVASALAAGAALPLATAIRSRRPKPPATACPTCGSRAAPR
ncbi:GlsB/YeaQ/YmgE family stress response membrane protein [Micromonospora sp. NBC_01813]|uniref:GlsB/YeaQ/YmgE family stress response membrane protein n=1 Tax=Micromonospora sp. NBC_01813 TaxID=2975988 RepID=UPI002DD8EB72|nr:GlsB/YeaQ/YmgE family stress response membrane protein [Micromonospora sp. NBC_01813]WSA08548.1 GlsB/YeaQ/YmgE family stress response membrane protein [Micromonospora sp. NBC_01813]